MRGSSTRSSMRRHRRSESDRLPMRHSCRGWCPFQVEVAGRRRRHQHGPRNPTRRRRKLTMGNHCFSLRNRRRTQQAMAHRARCLHRHSQTQMEQDNWHPTGER